MRDWPGDEGDSHGDCGFAGWFAGGDEVMFAKVRPLLSQVMG